MDAHPVGMLAKQESTVLTLECRDTEQLDRPRDLAEAAAGIFYKTGSAISRRVSTLLNDASLRCLYRKGI